MQEYSGQLHGNGMRIGIVVGRFNDLITRNLLNGALDGLRRHGVADENISTVWVPGAFEIPLIAKQMAVSARYDAIICLGAVIRGATPHFDYVAGQAAAGIAQIALENNMPVIFSVLTTNTIEEALERSGSKAGNKGYDGAMTAIEMVNLMRQLKQPKHAAMGSCCMTASKAAMPTHT